MDPLGGGRPLSGKPKAGDRRKRMIDEDVANKLQSKLKAACYGTTPAILFGRWDKDKLGTLDHEVCRSTTPPTRHAHAHMHACMDACPSTAHR